MFESGTLGIISTLLMVPAIIGIAWWAFAPRRKKRFDDAANLPFADEAGQHNTGQQQPSTDDPEENGQTTGNGDGADKRN